VKTVRDFQDDQRPSGGMPELAPDNTIYDKGLTEDTGPIGWMLAHPFLQDRLYMYYGDKELLVEQYQSTVRLIEFIRQQAPEHILRVGISDHASIAPKPEAVTSTAFYYHHVRLLARFAGIIGKTEDREKYNQLAEDIKKAFIAEFIVNGKVDSGTQAAQAIALYYGLLPEDQEQNALDILSERIVDDNNGHLSTGIFGTKMMYDVFRIYDRNDLGFLITSQKDFPGYGYMIENGGTTIWENWRGRLSSYNHPMFGSVSEWFYKSLAGICPEDDAIGFNRFIIKPGVVGDLDWVKASYHSVRGTIKSDWSIQNGNLHLEVSIPVNTIANIYIPSDNPEHVREGTQVLSGAEGILEYVRDDKYLRITAGSGDYHFVSSMEAIPW